MTCSPLQTAPRPPAADARDRSRLRAHDLLAQHGQRADEIPGAADADLETLTAACCTALMDLYRRTGDREVFDCLIELAMPQLQARVRSRLRSLGGQFDPQEVVQDAIVNIYRYPDRFAATRPGAFAAWSSTIVDNAIRRLLRRGRRGACVALSPTEVLSQQADLQMREPVEAAQEHEESAATASAFALLLSCYLGAFHALSDRERFVLEMVEVRGMRYHELAQRLAIRPEALKMVVFRARKRIFDRIAAMLGGPPAPLRAAG